MAGRAPLRRRRAARRPEGARRHRDGDREDAARSAERFRGERPGLRRPSTDGGGGDRHHQHDPGARGGLRPDRAHLHRTRPPRARPHPRGHRGLPRGTPLRRVRLPSGQPAPRSAGWTVRGPPGLLRGPQGAAGPSRPGQGARTPGIAPPLVVRLRAGRGGDGLLRPARTAHGRARPTPPAGPPGSGVRRHSRRLHPPRSPPDRDGARGAAARAGRPARSLRLLSGAVDSLPDGPGRPHRPMVDHGRGRLRCPERGPPHGLVAGARTGPGRSGVLRRVGPGGGPGTEGRPEPRADRRGIPGPRRGRRHGRPRVLGRRPSGRPVAPGGVLVLPGRGGVGPGGWGYGVRAAGGDGGPRPVAGRGAPAIPRPGPARRAGHAVRRRTEYRHRGGRRRIGRRGPGRPGDDGPGRRSVLPRLDATGDRNGGGDRRGPPGDGAFRRARARLLLTRPLRPSGRRRP